MYKGSARAQQLNTRTGNESTRPSAKGFSLLGGGDNPVDQLSPEEKRASLVAVFKGLQVELADAKVKKDPIRVKRIGVQIGQVCISLNELRPKRRSGDPYSIANIFVSICRERMTKPQFNAIMDEANRRQRAASESSPVGADKE